MIFVTSSQKQEEKMDEISAKIKKEQVSICHEAGKAGKIYQGLQDLQDFAYTQERFHWKFRLYFQKNEFVLLNLIKSSRQRRQKEV